jgi:uncharacterized repeat protein (TIGR01451 family)
MKRLFLASSLAALVVLTGCATPQRSHTSTDTTTVKQDAPVSTQSDRDSNYNWSSLSFPTGNERTSAIKLEKGMPKEVLLNQGFTYKIMVTNLTDMGLEGVTVSDVFSPNTKFTSATPKGTMAKDQITWKIGSLGANESRTITVNGKALRAGVVGSCATVTYSSELCATAPVVEPKLNLVKTGTSEALKCDPIQYKFVVSNPGTGSINGVKITDALPDGVVAADGSKSLNFNVGTLKPGESKTYNATVQATRTGKFINSAKATATGGLTANSGKVTTTVTQPVLAITKKGTDKMYVGGSRMIDYTITVSNNGDGVARDTKVVDMLPAGTKFVSASDGGRASGGQVTWNVGTLAPKATRTMTLRVQPTTMGTLTNNATATAYCAKQVNASWKTEVRGIPAVLLEVVDLEDPIEVGGTVTYQIRVTNQGSADGRNIAIKAILPAQMEYVSSGGPTTATASGKNVNFGALSTLAPGKTATFTIKVRATAAADVRFKVSMITAQSSVPVEETESTYIYE